MRKCAAWADVALLFATRSTRLFAFGALSVVLALYLAARGLDERAIGGLLTLALAGDAALSLAVTTAADRLGRRRMLFLGALLLAATGAALAFSRDPAVLLAVALVGVVSPSGNEVGPFLSIEQAALAQLVPTARLTRLFAWYHLTGSLATALGALSAGLAARALERAGATPLVAYRAVLLGYAVAGALLAALGLLLSPATEARGRGEPAAIAPPRLGLHRSRGVVARLAGLFSLDAFAGGLVVQSLMAYWFHLRFGADVATLGALFFGANLLAGVSALVAAPLAARIGLVRTMVVTHLPSNLLLAAVPLMPNLSSAVAVLLLRFSISQMDVPTRQAYLMAVVAADERTAAAGLTGIARSLGATASPALAGLLLARPALSGVPFFLAGGLKVVYDLLLYRSWKRARLPTEGGGAEPPSDSWT